MQMRLAAAASRSSALFGLVIGGPKLLFSLAAGLEG